MYVLTNLVLILFLLYGEKYKNKIFFLYANFALLAFNSVFVFLPITYNNNLLYDSRIFSFILILLSIILLIDYFVKSIYT